MSIENEIIGLWSVDVQYGPGAQSDDVFYFFPDGTGRYDVLNWTWCSSNLFNSSPYRPKRNSG